MRVLQSQNVKRQIAPTVELDKSSTTEDSVITDDKKEN